MAFTRKELELITEIEFQAIEHAKDNNRNEEEQTAAFEAKATELFNKNKDTIFELQKEKRPQNERLGGVLSIFIDQNKIEQLNTFMKLLSGFSDKSSEDIIDDEMDKFRKKELIVPVPTNATDLVRLIGNELELLTPISSAELIDMVKGIMIDEVNITNLNKLTADNKYVWQAIQDSLQEMDDYFMEQWRKNSN